MFCIHCGNRISDEAKYCPKCGKAVDEKISQEISSEQSAVGKNCKKKYFIWILLGVVVIVGILFIWMNTNSSKEKQTDETVVSENGADEEILAEQTEQEVVATESIEPEETIPESAVAEETVVEETAEGSGKSEENQKALEAYYNVLVNGAAAQGLLRGGDWFFGTDYPYGIGYFCLYDFDSDGIDEFIGTGMFPNLVEGTCEGTLLLDYMENDVYVLTGHPTIGYGLVPLTNGCLCSFEVGMIAYETTYRVEEYDRDSVQEATVFAAYDDGISSRYSINGVQVDEETFNTYLQEKVLSKQIPDSNWKEYDAENLTFY